MLKVGKVRQQHIEQLLVELFLQRQRFPFRRQYFVLILLQFRNNVALGVFQRLAADVVNRGMLALAAADLNVVTVHGIVTDLQRVQPQAFAFANFQLIEIVGGAIRQRAPFIELLMVARGNNAAVAHQHRRRVDNCAFEQFAQFAELAHFIAQPLDRRAADVSQHLAQDRQLLERMTHAGEVARTRGAQRQSRQNTFQIAHLT